MRSKARISSHPLHPLLIPFPITLFIGTLVFDVLAYLQGNESFAATARYLNIGGVASALLAAVPGIIDYTFTLPPNSSAKKRGAKHGLLNITNVLLFSVALYGRYNGFDSRTIIGLEVLGCALLFVAGWLGGTLVYRNQIGVDVRYADSQKWKEGYLKEENSIEAGTSDELKENGMKLLHIGQKRIVLARTATGYVAFEDRCPHKGGSLASGSMMCGTVQCPWHGSQFDVRNGEVKAGPAKERINTYLVREEGGKLYLDLD
jgi:nitrite reductase/ring-hydroxylating ferredoxin subunit/uncharacterized membrane protein